MLFSGFNKDSLNTLSERSSAHFGNAARQGADDEYRRNVGGTNLPQNHTISTNYGLNSLEHDNTDAFKDIASFQTGSEQKARVDRIQHFDRSKQPRVIEIMHEETEDTPVSSKKEERTSDMMQYTRTQDEIANQTDLSKINVTSPFNR